MITRKRLFSNLIIKLVFKNGELESEPISSSPLAEKHWKIVCGKN
jgi:hypothetical protein